MALKIMGSTSRIMILARLAVDKEHQRKGLGRALLKDPKSLL